MTPPERPPCPRCGRALIPTVESPGAERGRPGVGPTFYCAECDRDYPAEPPQTETRARWERQRQGEVVQ